MTPTDRSAARRSARSALTRAPTPALLRLMAEATDDARTAAMDALAALRAEAAIPAFVALARRRPDRRRRATRAARARQDRDAGGDRGADRPDADAAGLGGHPGGAACRRSGRPCPDSSASSPSGTPGSAAIAAATLGEIGDRHATAPLCAALERRAELAPVALDALARIGDAAAIPTLVRAAESGDLETRRRGYAALLALRDPRASVALARGLADADPYVRELSARLAAAIGAPGLRAGRCVAARSTANRTSAAPPRPSLATLAAPSSALVTAHRRRDHEARRARDATATSGRRSARRSNGRPNRATPADWPRPGRRARGGAAGAGARARRRAGRPPVTDSSACCCSWSTRWKAKARFRSRRPMRSPPAAMPAEARGRLRAPLRRAAPTVRARLCDAIARMPEGGRWLAALMRARDEPTEVRAAAAWAARGLDDGDARDALAAAARDDVAARGGQRARRARAGVGRPPSRPADLGGGARCARATARPSRGRWVAISVANAGDVWAMTDDAGGVRLFAVPAGPVRCACRARCSGRE